MLSTTSALQVFASDFPAHVSSISLKSVGAPWRRLCTQPLSAQVGHLLLCRLKMIDADEPERVGHPEAAIARVG